MLVGLQFEAPNGWGSFQTNVRYYLAGDRTDVIDGSTVPSVLVVWFTQSTKKSKNWRTHVLTLPRSDLEDALLAKPPKLKRLDHRFNLPPWLQEIDDVSFDYLEERRPTLRKGALGEERERGERQTYRQQVERRLARIWPAIESANQILHAKDPLAEISQTVKSDRSLHPHRAQLWFFAYLLHGQNQWALKSPPHRIGRWLRNSEPHEGKKFGRPPSGGVCFGWSAVGMREGIVNEYLKRCGPGKTMRSIYRQAVREEFGCVVVPDANGKDILIQPQNRPFPSEGQFRYAVRKELGLDVIQKNVYGEPRTKITAKFNKSNQTGKYASVLEALQVDAYRVLDRPRSMYSNEASEALVVAEGVCMTTGAVVGVGFSFGGEKGEAYRSLLFCMAAPKTYIARLYGIPQRDLNWSMQGICGSFTSDRGPAGHEGIAARLEQQFPVKSIPPSFDGKAKAVVESAHPRSVKLEGAPTYVISEQNVIQMVKREIYRAVKANHVKDISGRLSEQAIRDFHRERRPATPHEYWHYLTERLRTSARNMSLQEAVRAFWTPVRLKVDRDGVRFRHRHYVSKELLSSQLMKQVGLVRDLEVNAFVFSLVVRNIWVDINGKLMELEAARRTRIDQEELVLPISDFEKNAQLLKEIRARTRQSAHAATVRAEADFEKLTGLRWDAGERRKGTPPKPSGADSLEVKVIKGPTRRRSA